MIPACHVRLQKLQQAKAERTLMATPNPTGDGNDFMDPCWAEARTAIQRVFTDAGATDEYWRLIHQGQTRYGAVLGTQQHDAHAQGSISQYGEARTVRFMRSIGRS
jgi:hypothetical protein